MSEVVLKSKMTNARYRSAMNLIESSSTGFVERAARRLIGETCDEIWCVGDDTTIDDEVVAACLLKIFTNNGKETT